jgi:hypothetical protein
MFAPAFFPHWPSALTPGGRSWNCLGRIVEETRGRRARRKVDVLASDNMINEMDKIHEHGTIKRVR